MTHESNADETLDLHHLRDRSNVVVGVDGSESSQRALRWAAGMARRTQGRLVAVHVRRLILAYDGIAPQGVVDDGGLDPQIRDEIRDVAAECEVDLVYVDQRTESGTAPVLARIAEEVRADLIVVGASSHPLHRLAGSVGAQLVKHCGSPVTVVP